MQLKYPHGIKPLEKIAPVVSGPLDRSEATKSGNLKDLNVPDEDNVCSEAVNSPRELDEHEHGGR